jgi:hypothetical protein
VAPSPVFVEQRSRVLHGVVDGVPIVIDTCREASRVHFVPHTRVTGRAVAPVALRLSVQTRQELEAPESEAFAERPARVTTPDDPDFEQRFVVRASAPDSTRPPAQIRALLGEELRAALVRFPEPLLLTYEAGETRLLWEGEENDDVALGLGAEIVLAACRFRPATGYR